MTLSFYVPGTPVGKARPRFVKATGRAYTTKATRLYEQHVRYHAQDAMSELGITEPMTGYFKVTIRAMFQVPPSYSAVARVRALDGLSFPPRPDIDQLCKSILDAMNAVVYEDDRCVVSVQASKDYHAEAGVYVKVELV